MAVTRRHAHPDSWLLDLPWAGDKARARIRAIQAVEHGGLNKDPKRVALALESHTTAMDEDGLVLHAGTNATLGEGLSRGYQQLGMRPSLGSPGDKAHAGFEHLEVAELLTMRAVAATMGARFAEVRPPSATIANLAVYTSLVPVGATLAALPAWAGGHVSHHASGVPAVRGHRVVELPYDPELHDVDIDALPGFLEAERPRLLILGGSLVLFPHRLAEISAVSSSSSIPVLYDASHTAGLIAGKRFQDPLADGVEVVSFSTYKSFGGPSGGAIVTDRAWVAERVASAVYPCLTANYDPSRLRALATAAGALLHAGAEYASTCINCAQALARSLGDNGMALVGVERGLTESHQVAFKTSSAKEAAVVSCRLADAGIYTSDCRAPSCDGPVSAIRLGTPELVRRGFATHDFEEVGELVARLASGRDHPATVRRRVRALRARVAAHRASQVPARGVRARHQRRQ